MKCPKCKSNDAKVINYLGIDCAVCSKCGFDGRDVYEQYPGEKGSQKAKGSFSPYKAGGSSRVRK